MLIAIADMYAFHVDLFYFLSNMILQLLYCAHILIRKGMRSGNHFIRQVNRLLKAIISNHNACVQCLYSENQVRVTMVWLIKLSRVASLSGGKPKQNNDQHLRKRSFDVSGVPRRVKQFHFVKNI